MEEHSEKKEYPLEKRVKKIKIKFFNWLKNPYNKVFLGILIFTIIIRIYFFIITKNQAVWWDAADYLNSAKVMAEIIDIDYFFTPRRTFLMPLFWAGLLKLGFGELSFRILGLLFSIMSIVGMYLMGKEIFNKKIGLIACFLMSIFWMNLFYSTRLMTEIPTLTFLLFSSFFFWKGYTKKDEKAFIWFGLCLGLAFLARAGTIIMFAVFPIFLLITERLKFLKRKYLWMGAGVTTLLMTAFFIITSYTQKVNAFKHFLALTPDVTQGGVTRLEQIGILGISAYINIDMLTHYFGTILLSLFVISLIMFLFYLFLSSDIIIKRKSKKYDKYLFIFIFALIPIIFQSYFYGGAEDRYLMNAFPAFFIILSIGISNIGNFFRKYNKYIPLIIILLSLSLGAYHQIDYANNLIKPKISSYLEVKQSGEWIKENSQPEDIIFSASVPQHIYYAERKTYNFMEEWRDQSVFEEKLEEIKPSFLILSMFEPHAQWAYEYPEKHPEKFTILQAYRQNKQPVLLIYKINY